MENSNVRKLLMSAALLVAGATMAGAQDCNSLFLLKKEAIIELTRFDGTHRRVGGKMVNKVMEAEQAADGTLRAVVSSYNITDAGDTNSTTTLCYICDNKKMTIVYGNYDIARQLYAGLEDVAKGNKGKKFVFTSLFENIEYPLALIEGEELKPYTVTNLSSSIFTEEQRKAAGLPEINHHYNSLGIHDYTEVKQNYINILVDRKLVNGTSIRVKNIRVGGKETVETPLGKYECTKVTKELYSGVYAAIEVIDENDGKKKSKKNMDAPMQIITEWYAAGLGPVKTEIKNAEGKVLITLEATNIVK